MLTLPGAQIFLVAGATDMRKSFNGLPAIVQNTVGRDPLRGVYVFCNARRNRLKILFYDSGGYWVCAKRLERGTFAWPEEGGTSLRMTREELALLLGGIDLVETKRRRWYKHAANE
jgi:transposase